MRILLLADQMESGGAETHIETLAAGLLRAGHMVGLLSSGGQIADRMANAGVFCRKIPPIGKNPAAFFSAKAILRAEVQKNGYQILHAHTRMTALLLHKICNPCMQKTPKMPCRVVTAHAKFATGGIKRAFSYWGERTIAISEDLRAHLVDHFGVPAERVTVIPNGIDATVFFPPQERAEREFHILFVSRLEPDCSLGAQLLCRSVAALAGGPVAPFRATIAGRGSLFGELSALAGRVNLTLGRPLLRVVRPAAGQAAVAELYRSADLFLGVSRAAMEASFCGCAVLLCGNEGYGGLLTPARSDLAAGNFCCREEPKPTQERLTADLYHLLQNPDQIRAVATQTSRWLQSDFSAANMCNLTEKLYQQLLWEKGEAEEEE